MCAPLWTRRSPSCGSQSPIWPRCCPGLEVQVLLVAGVDAGWGYADELDDDLPERPLEWGKHRCSRQSRRLEPSAGR